MYKYLKNIKRVDLNSFRHSNIKFTKNRYLNKSFKKYYNFNSLKKNRLVIKYYFCIVNKIKKKKFFLLSFVFFENFYKKFKQYFIKGRKLISKKMNYSISFILNFLFLFSFDILFCFLINSKENIFCLKSKMFSFEIDCNKRKNKKKLDFKKTYKYDKNFFFIVQSNNNFFKQKNFKDYKVNKNKNNCLKFFYLKKEELFYFIFFKHIYCYINFLFHFHSFLFKKIQYIIIIKNFSIKHFEKKNMLLMASFCHVHFPKANERSNSLIYFINQRNTKFLNKFSFNNNMFFLFNNKNWFNNIIFELYNRVLFLNSYFSIFINQKYKNIKCSKLNQNIYNIILLLKFQKIFYCIEMTYFLSKKKFYNKTKRFLFFKIQKLLWNNFILKKKSFLTLYSILFSKEKYTDFYSDFNGNILKKKFVYSIFIKKIISSFRHLGSSHLITKDKEDSQKKKRKKEPKRQDEPEQRYKPNGYYNIYNNKFKNIFLNFKKIQMSSTLFYDTHLPPSFVLLTSFFKKNAFLPLQNEHKTKNIFPNNKTKSNRKIEIILGPLKFGLSFELYYNIFSDYTFNCFIKQSIKTIKSNFLFYDCLNFYKQKFLNLNNYYFSSFILLSQTEKSCLYNLYNLYNNEYNSYKNKKKKDFFRTFDYLLGSSDSMTSYNQRSSVSRLYKSLFRFGRTVGFSLFVKAEQRSKGDDTFISASSASRFAKEPALLSFGCASTSALPNDALAQLRRKPKESKKQAAMKRRLCQNLYNYDEAREWKAIQLSSIAEEDSQNIDSKIAKKLSNLFCKSQLDDSKNEKKERSNKTLKKILVKKNKIYELLLKKKNLVINNQNFFHVLKQLIEILKEIYLSFGAHGLWSSIRRSLRIGYLGSFAKREAEIADAKATTKHSHQRSLKQSLQAKVRPFKFLLHLKRDFIFNKNLKNFIFFNILLKSLYPYSDITSNFILNTFEIENYLTLKMFFLIKKFKKINMEYLTKNSISFFVSELNIQNTFLAILFYTLLLKIYFFECFYSQSEEVSFFFQKTNWQSLNLSAIKNSQQSYIMTNQDKEDGCVSYKDKRKNKDDEQKKKFKDYSEIFNYKKNKDVNQKIIHFYKKKEKNYYKEYIKLYKIGFYYGSFLLNFNINFFDIVDILYKNFYISFLKIQKLKLFNMRSIKSHITKNKYFFKKNIINLFKYKFFKSILEKFYLNKKIEKKKYLKSIFSLCNKSKANKSKNMFLYDFKKFFFNSSFFTIYKNFQITQIQTKSKFFLIKKWDPLKRIYQKKSNSIWKKNKISFFYETNYSNIFYNSKFSNFLITDKNNIFILNSKYNIINKFADSTVAWDIKFNMNCKENLFCLKKRKILSFEKMYSLKKNGLNYKGFFFFFTYIFNTLLNSKKEKTNTKDSLILDCLIKKEIFILKNHKMQNFHPQYFNFKINTGLIPSKKFLKKHLNLLKNTILKSNSQTQKKLLYKLNLRIMNWSYYYKIVTNSQLFFYCDSLINKLIWKWACRTHPNKSKKWIQQKYFFSLKNKKWVFGILPQNFDSKSSRTDIFYLPFHNFLINF
jgi:hypothetical protein